MNASVAEGETKCGGLPVEKEWVEKASGRSGDSLICVVCFCGEFLFALEVPM